MFTPVCPAVKERGQIGIATRAPAIGRHNGTNVQINQCRSLLVGRGGHVGKPPFPKHDFRIHFLEGPVTDIAVGAGDLPRDNILINLVLRITF